jgi:hypothetical protein
MEVKMQLKKYNHPVLFYSIAIFVPWFCWFILAWLSHSKWWDNPDIFFGGSILGVIGLCGPFAIAMFLILPDKEMRQELISQIINFKGIRLKYWILNIAIFPVSILAAMAISLIKVQEMVTYNLICDQKFSKDYKE